MDKIINFIAENISKRHLDYTARKEIEDKIKEGLTKVIHVESDVEYLLYSLDIKIQESNWDRI